MIKQFWFFKIISIAVFINVLVVSVSYSENEMKAEGSFEVQLFPQTTDEVDAGRVVISKTYTGGMNGTGNGQMLSKRTSVEGSAAYVAIEEFVGTVNGMEGSLTLQHTGSMSKGVNSLSVVVVPDSGTGELTGISGSLQIIIEEGKHSYIFEYSIGE